MAGLDLSARAPDLAMLRSGYFRKLKRSLVRLAVENNEETVEVSDSRPRYCTVVLMST